MPLLEVEGLSIDYRSTSGSGRILEEVGLELNAGEILAVVGESGSGKSTLAAAVMRLLPPNASVAGGRIRFEGQDLLSLGPDAMASLRGRRLSMVFQDPMTSLHPALTVGTQMIDAQLAHGLAGRRDARRRAETMLRRVGIPDPQERLAHYPHEFSGGMRQRIHIATALLLEPALLIADEPTASLDVTLQAQILAMLRELNRERGTAILFITHDLGVAAEIADRVAVMYAGRIVETGAVADTLARPLHPYTEALLQAVPRRSRRGRRLATIPGRVPPPSERPSGCGFARRCGLRRALCEHALPATTMIAGRSVLCHARDANSGYAEERS